MERRPALAVRAWKPAQPHRLLVIELRCSGEELVSKGDLLVGQGVQVLRPALAHRAIDSADLGVYRLKIDSHDHPPPIMRIPGSDDDSSLFQPVDGSRDGTACSKPGSLREVAGRRRSDKHHQP